MHDSASATNSALMDYIIFSVSREGVLRTFVLLPYGIVSEPFPGSIAFALGDPLIGCWLPSALPVKVSQQFTFLFDTPRGVKAPLRSYSRRWQKWFHPVACTCSSRQTPDRVTDTAATLTPSHRLLLSPGVWDYIIVLCLRTPTAWAPIGAYSTWLKLKLQLLSSLFDSLWTRLYPPFKAWLLIDCTGSVYNLAVSQQFNRFYNLQLLHYIVNTCIEVGICG